MTSRNLLQKYVLDCMYFPPSPKSHLYWPPPPLWSTFSELNWNAVSWAIALIWGQIKLNFNFHVVHFQFFKPAPCPVPCRLPPLAPSKVGSPHPQQGSLFWLKAQWTFKTISSCWFKMSVLSHFHQAFSLLGKLRSHLPSFETSHNPSHTHKKTENKNVKENQTEPGWILFCHAEPHDSVKSPTLSSLDKENTAGW